MPEDTPPTQHPDEDHIAHRLAAGFTRSFEFFPPKTDAGLRNLEKTVAELSALEPDFVSITYGAGGSTRERTRDLVVDISAAHRFPAMPHLTCMGHTRAEIEQMLDDYASHGIANVLALAGDPPADGSTPVGDFTFASELVALARDRTDFSIGVAAHPELHPRSPDRESDRRRLAAKLSAADFGISQFFFDHRDYLQMVDELAALGCDTPVIPGLIPVVNPTSVRRFAVMNGAAVPEDLWARLEAADDTDRMAIAVEAAVELGAALLAEGVPGLHFYTLNAAEATVRVCADLSLPA